MRIAKQEPEQVVVHCHEVNEEIKEIVTFIQSREGKMTGSMDEKQYQIPLRDILYVEAVDNRVFFYTKKNAYETKQRLYEWEKILCEKYFLRVSKSLLLNLMKVRAIKPAMNGRLTAILHNGEEVIISRKYVPDLKNALKGGDK